MKECGWAVMFPIEKSFHTFIKFKSSERKIFNELFCWRRESSQFQFRLVAFKLLMGHDETEDDQLHGN